MCLRLYPPIGVKYNPQWREMAVTERTIECVYDVYDCNNQCAYCYCYCYIL